MKIKTALGSGVALAIVALGGIQMATGGWPGGDRAQGSREMAKPRKMKMPEPGPSGQRRGRVILQLCWYPDQDVQASVGWRLGRSDVKSTTYDKVGTPLNCQTPWMRTAVLGEGDQALVSWTLTKGVVSRFQYRITVNNRVRVEGSMGNNAGAAQCVIGVPPCELP